MSYSPRDSKEFDMNEQLTFSCSYKASSYIYIYICKLICYCSNTKSFNSFVAKYFELSNKPLKKMLCTLHII